MKALKKISLMVFSLLLVFILGYNNKLFAENINDNEKKLVYVENIFYDENGKSVNGWYNDDKEMFFFQNGKKFTGFTKDKGESKYFVNGKYGIGIYKDVLYKNGVKSKGRVYVDGIFYGDDAKLANWWYNDGTAWYFFKDGKKHTGLAKDGNGALVNKGLFFDVRFLLLVFCILIFCLSSFLYDLLYFDIGFFFTN